MGKRNTEEGKPYKRYRYKWNSRAFKILICFLSILLLLLSAYGAWTLSQTIRFTQDRFQEVNDAKELISQIEYSSRTGEKVNLALHDDIDLSQEDIDALHNLPNREGSAGAWFYGTLNGQYKKITFKTDTILDAPLFSCITEGSKILNLSIENPVLSVQGTNGALATLSHTNLGTLENIRLNNCTVNLSGAGSKTLSVSGLVVYNFGTISHCATKIRAAFLSEGYDDGIYFSQNGQKINVRWKCQFGAIAAECIGEGLIENVVTSVTFPNGFAPLSLAPYNEEQERNLIVGYVVGYSKDFTLGNNGEKSNKGTLRDLFVLNSQNTQYACDHDYFEEGDSTFICEKTKDWDGWKSDANIDEGFPQFVFATGVNQ